LLQNFAPRKSAFISNRNRYVTVVHASAPKIVPIDALGASIHASLRPDVHAAVRFPQVEPNARGESRLEAGATEARTLEADGCKALCGMASTTQTQRRYS
jgi:hypothetical protein